MNIPNMSSAGPFSTRAPRLRRLVQRFISLDQGPRTSGAIPIELPNLADSESLDAVKSLPILQATDSVQLEALGAPPQALSVSAPPSLPVYIRRNSMMALSANPAHVSFKQRLLSPFSRLAAGNFVSRYQELVGTEQFTVILSAKTPSWFPAYFSRVTPKSFANVTLDGTADWALLTRDALHMYAGPSLEVSVRRVPAKISRGFSRKLALKSREPTGFRQGYTFVHGRGVLGLVGNGMVYQASVAEGESIAVSRPHLVGISVNGPHDLQNCVVAHETPMQIQNVVVVPPPRAPQLASWRDFWTESKYFYWRLFDLFRQVRGRSLQRAISTHDFVRIVGPRTILLQSGAPHESFERKFELPKLTPSTHLEVLPAKTPEPTPADYLNVVTIEPGKKPAIESVNDFKDALQKKN